MSQADVERFINDLKNDPGLLEGLKSEATGVASVVDFAKSKGYDITLDEARAYIAEQSKQELSDEQLDAIAGGKDSPQGSQIGTNIQATTVELSAVVVSTLQTTDSVQVSGSNASLVVTVIA